MLHAPTDTSPSATAVLQASPAHLVRLLYDAALAHLEACCNGLADAATARTSTTGRSLSRAMAIVGELRASLDHAGDPEVALELDRLYEYCLEQLAAANLTRTRDGVENTLLVLRTLQDGWDRVLTD